jgi:hypothetical protein
MSDEIERRPVELGGGWGLRPIENNEQVGNGVSPLNPPS